MSTVAGSVSKPVVGINYSKSITTAGVGIVVIIWILLQTAYAFFALDDKEDTIFGDYPNVLANIAELCQDIKKPAAFIEWALSLVKPPPYLGIMYINVQHLFL
ncbi:hypothetical protein CPB84DRAFT_1753260 [Gymnopilus junonius]|uniref:Uncharacterized protein n=1 Tax=Gymnopilus junonius TaxID=109634 RepID=A0A9P5TF89_GYMJU|nr:hypothetical protein CPB84DRAFT_1753260 [Gymnopilus junonius]